VCSIGKKKGVIFVPFIHVSIVEGHTVEEKRRFAANITKLACEDLKVSADQVWVKFSEMKNDNFAVAGALIADRK
jgi:4-oxalocrotonate tautomerase family enzyme